MELDRKRVLSAVLNAFSQTAKNDYAHKYTDNEEDLRAATYMRLRATLDVDPHWRAFLDFPFREKRSADFQKPDLLIFRSDSPFAETNGVKLELFAEFKSWPKLEEILADIGKLKRYGEALGGDVALVFAAILKKGMSRLEVTEALRADGSSVNDYMSDYRVIADGATKVYLALYGHDHLYQGPWDNAVDADPWRHARNEIARRLDAL